MTIEVFKERFQTGFESLAPEINSAAQVLLNRDVALALEIQEDTGIETLLAAEKTPLFCVGFRIASSRHVLVFSPELATQIYAWMIGDEPTEKVTEEHLDGIKEATQQIWGQIKIAMGGDIGALDLSDLTVRMIETSGDLQAYLEPEEGILCQYQCTLGKEQKLIKHYLWPGALLEESEAEAELEEDTTAGNPQVDIQPAEFSAIEGGEVKSQSMSNVNMLLDVDLEITVELGRKRMLISDILKLGKGSVVELDKSAGEPLVLYVNGRKMAEGEVVVVDDHFAIRITQLVSPTERIRSLR